MQSGWAGDLQRRHKLLAYVAMRVRFPHALASGLAVAGLIFACGARTGLIVVERGPAAEAGVDAAIAVQDSSVGARDVCSDKTY
jgi:hypothetical protein